MQHKLEQSDVIRGCIVSLTVGAELTGYGDFHFTFVWVNEEKPEKP